MLPGAHTTAGKLAYGAGLALVLALCVWQTMKRAQPPPLESVPCIVVCDACGQMEFDREVPIRRDGSPQLPLECRTCGKKAVYLSYYCPTCGKPIPVDPKQPPAKCKHCAADLKGMFDRPPK